MFSASGAIGSVVGWTMIHLLWVIVLLYLLHRLLQWFLRRFAANIRYAAACAMLLLIALAAGALLALPWLVQFDLPFIPQIRAVATALGLGVVDTHLGGVDPVYYQQFRVDDRWSMRAWAARCEPALSWLGVVWLVGAVWRLLPRGREMVGLWWTVRTSEPSGVDLSEPQYAKVRSIWGGRSVPVRESRWIDGPCVAGWLSPVILLPLGLATQIRPDLLLCILYHEMAHIRRRDYAVNLLQIVTESVFFFHPCVKWLSEEIRILREACCDDTAIVTTGSSKLFGEALITFENLRPGLRLAIGMADASVKSRVERLVVLKREQPRQGYRRFITLLLSVLTLLLIGAMPMSGIAEDYRDQIRVATEGSSPAILEGMGLRRDNPELFPALQRLAAGRSTYRTLTPQDVQEVVEIASRGAREDQVMRARLPWLRLEMGPEYDNPEVVAPTDGQIAQISSMVFFRVRELAPGPERDQWMRAAMVLGSLQGWMATPRVQTFVRHARFEELSGCSREEANQYRRLISIEMAFNTAGNQALWDAEDHDLTRLPDLLDRFTYPLGQRRWIAASAADLLPLGDPTRQKVAAKLRATGLDYDAKLADLVEQPLTGIRARVGRASETTVGRRYPRPPEPVPATRPAS